MTTDEQATWKAQIDGMSARECASLQRFAPAGHPIFDSRNGLYDYFREHFAQVGGMTPAISKEIGW